MNGIRLYHDSTSHTNLASAFRYSCNSHQTCVSQSPVVIGEHRWNVLERWRKHRFTSKRAGYSVEGVLVYMRVTLILCVIRRLKNV